MCLGSQPPRDCNICLLWKGLNNKKPGKRIPAPGGGWASGKCTWDQGPETCKPKRVRGQIGEIKA